MKTATEKLQRLFKEKVQWYKTTRKRNVEYYRQIETGNKWEALGYTLLLLGASVGYVLLLVWSHSL